MVRAGMCALCVCVFVCVKLTEVMIMMIMNKTNA